MLVLTGVEHVTISPGDTVMTPLRFDSYPWSHSLLTLVVWGAIFAAIHFARRRRGRAAIVLWALVVSHWVLDYVSHRPDVPLTPWTSVRVGLGLWNSPPGTVLVEAGLFVVGVVLCFQATRARDRIGSWGLYGFLALLAVVYLAALAGPPPPTVTALGWASLALPALLLPFAAWVDRHRRPA